MDEEEDEDEDEDEDEEEVDEEERMRSLGGDASSCWLGAADVVVVVVVGLECLK